MNWEKYLLFQVKSPIKILILVLLILNEIIIEYQLYTSCF